MDLSLSLADREFRDEVRTFLATAVPTESRAIVRAGGLLDKAQQVEWQRILQSRGWLAQGWPREHGGCNWSATRRHLFDEECVRADAPFVNPFGLYRVGPVIIAFGSEWQKQHFLPRILSSSDWWCQGYSEATAGSDLAALRMSAQRERDHYIVNGSKLWTSMAHYADWIFCLVRTDKGVRRRDGISFLLVDLASPGISIQPIRTLDGRHHVNEVVFDEVRVPACNLVGVEGEGWKYSRYLLGFERLQIAEVPQSKRLLRTACRVAREAGMPRGCADELTRLRARLTALEITTFRFIAAMDAGASPGAEASLLKIQGSRLRQDITGMLADLLGPDAYAYRKEGAPPEASSPLLGHFLYSRASTIYGGSNEIQKNILSRALFGL